MGESKKSFIKTEEYEENSNQNTIKIENLEPNQDTFISTDELIAHNKSQFKVTTQELLLASILGVMGGFISGLIPFSLLVKTWYPFVGGTQLVSGHHILWMAIVFGLTKKYPVVLFTAIIQGFVNFLLGSSWGLFEIVIYLYEGVSLLLGFIIIIRLKEFETNLGWFIAGGIGNCTQVPLFWIMTGKIYILDPTLFIMAIMFAFISGGVIAGIMGRAIVNRLKNAGIY